MKNINKKSILSIVLYALAILIAIYSIFTMYSSYTYISSLVEAGNIVIKDQLSDVISYFINASLPYVFYAIVIWAIGYIISRLNYIIEMTNPNKENEIVEK